MDEARTQVFDQLAVVGKAFANAKRLELVELLSQGERTVDSLATEAGIGVTTASAHLQVLKLSSLVCGSPRIVEGFSMRLPGWGPWRSRS